MDKGKIISALKNIIYPDSNRDIFSMHMIEKMEIEGNQISITLALPSLKNPHKSTLNFSCIQEIQKVYPDASVNIHMVARPSNFSQNETKNGSISNIKNIIAVASGKGGVGKSTVSTNLALSLKKLGATVGLVDTDLYGPSIPTMFGLQGKRPKIQKVNGQEKIVPLVAHGIPVMSIGFIVAPEQAIVMRGPRLAAIIRQFFNDVLWPSLDYLIVDLPPGTGDIQLSLVQTVSVTGAIMVTTPQRVALADAIKAVNMFKVPQVDVPIVGVVENMSWFTPEAHPDEKYHLFGKGGGEQLARLCQSHFLGHVPIVQSIREGGDNGKPVALDDDSITAQYFLKIAENAMREINYRNVKKAPTEVVKIIH